MRISDWSSDVCSSDLAEPGQREVNGRRPTVRHLLGKFDQHKDAGIAREEQHDVGIAEQDHRRRHEEARSDLPLRALERLVPAKRQGVIGLAEQDRSEEHTSELQSLMRISYAVFCL